MPSTYTTNLGIEKIATGEQSGTWGTTTNTNLDLIDEAVNGVEQVTLAAAGSSGSPNDLPITNGSSSDGRNKFIEFVDGGDLGGTAFVQLTPNDAEKVVHIRNSLSADRTITIFQGTYNASNDFVIPNGADVVLKFDGAGAGAVVSDVNVNLTPTKLTTATADITTGNITTVNATTVDSTNLEVTNLKAKDGTSAGSIADSTGVVTLASSVLTTTDINGGSVDGATLGTNSAITEAQIDNININGNAITSTDTNGNIALTPDGTGEVDISKVDIDGGTIDDTTIGGSTPAAGSFTTITGSGDMNIDSGTLFVDASADAVGIGTSSPTADLHILKGTPEIKLQSSGAGTDNTLSFLSRNISNVGAFANIIVEGAGHNSTNAPIVFTQGSGQTERMRIATNGDISFYEDTGTTPKLFWDASAESLGIGTTSPSSFDQVGADDLVVGGGASNHGITIYSGTGSSGGIAFADGTTTTDQYRGRVQYAHTDDSMRLFTSATERTRIDSSGNLLVGTTSGSAKLSVIGSNTTCANFNNTNNTSGDSSVISRLGSNCNNTSSYLFIGETGSANKAFIYGNGNIVNVNNSYGALSDQKLKENIVDSSSQWEDIKAVRVRKYSMIEEQSDVPTKIGVIAQELEEAGMSGLVFESPDRQNEGETVKQVNYSVLYMKSIKALQEAIGRIETLEAEVAALKGA